MYRCAFTVAFATIIAASATSTQATVRVGEANAVQRNVFGSQIGQQQRKVFTGDDVYENDLIRTETASSARILFVDDTDVNIGPATALKLDRVVFNPDQSVRALKVIADEGAIRWSSGHSPSRAYEVKTPTALVRVHGTVFDLFVEPRRTAVLLREGIIEVCIANAPDRCRTVSRSGDLMVVTSTSIEGPQQGGPGASDFAALCLSAASAKCTLAASADPPPPSRRAESGEPTSPTAAGNNQGRPVYEQPPPDGGRVWRRPPIVDPKKGNHATNGPGPPPPSHTGPIWHGHWPYLPPRGGYGGPIRYPQGPVNEPRHPNFGGGSFHPNFMRGAFHPHFMRGSFHPHFMGGFRGGRMHMR